MSTPARDRGLASGDAYKTPAASVTSTSSNWAGTLAALCGLVFLASGAALVGLVALDVVGVVTPGSLLVLAFKGLLLSAIVGAVFMGIEKVIQG